MTTVEAAELTGFASLCERRGDEARAATFRWQADELRRVLDEHAWDGEWYRRAYYDDGTPLGPAGSQECQIDSIAQSWAVLSGAGNPACASQGMDAVTDRLVLLFTPGGAWVGAAITLVSASEPDEASECYSGIALLDRLRQEYGVTTPSSCSV
ncbi:MAG: hypothetical protein KKB13_11545 [Chloroflexi bacterium]|nr:hypothetical protein [Chloroflexota bacterium]